ncbi:MAG TPA: FlgD immunoglobulin-like domain containing protein, partial [candidate division Zixibacteria bacterium]|nr:FlgD immunoglobulin-like domain containing protein [candidate division Zixibacteria bacterium]
FVESILSLDSAGAVGMVAYTRWGWVYSSYNLHRAFLAHLYSDAAGDPVAAMNAAAADYPYYRDLIYGQNYFGDPTVRIHLSVPEKYALDVDTDSWAAGRVTARVSVGGAPAVNEPVWLAQGGVRLAEGQTDDQGYVTLTADLALGETYVVALTPESALVSLYEFTPGLAADVTDEGEPSLPTEFRLAQNYPNPFNPSTTISWEQPERAPVTLVVFDVLGRTVSQTDLGVRSAGAHSLIWDGVSDGAASLASGVYLYQLRAGALRATRKMTLLK